MIESLFRNGNFPAVKTLLDVAALRHEAIARNVANVETPGYKRVDLEKTFSAQLDSALRRGDRQQLAELTPSLAVDPADRGSRADGNNVHLDRELLAMTQNATNFDALTQFASGSLRTLRVAITGRTA